MLVLLGVENQCRFKSKGFAWGPKFCEQCWKLAEKRKAVVRKETADMDECKEELSFVPSLRHRVDNGGRRWRVAQDKRLPERLQLETRRK